MDTYPMLVRPAHLQSFRQFIQNQFQDGLLRAGSGKLVYVCCQNCRSRPLRPPTKNGAPEQKRLRYCTHATHGTWQRGSAPQLHFWGLGLKV